MFVSKTYSQNPTQTFNAGSYIVDMGQNSTLNKVLKPYGFVFALIRNNNVPVYWSINSAKVKDGKDFTANGKDYKGGTFIIASEDINPTITTLIATWRSNGAVIDGPISTSFTAPIYNKLTSWPRAILDTQNDGLITPYYANAGIPSSSYVTEGDPTDLTSCGDIYVLPHADPQNWPASYVTALKNYMNQGGSLWVGCHAVSALDLVNPAFNFLTNNGLVAWGDHGKPDNSDVYTYDPTADTDPIMQFMGKMDASLHNGSEEIYLPKVGSSWLATTKVAIYDNPYTDDKTHITYNSTKLLNSYKSKIEILLNGLVELE
jgi:hypothetical protein